jgi:hypothetical protein
VTVRVKAQVKARALRPVLIGIVKEAGGLLDRLGSNSPKPGLEVP